MGGSRGAASARPLAARRRRLAEERLGAELSGLRIIGRKDKIPEATVNRLSIYCRVLNQLEEEGRWVVSSSELAVRCALNAAQIRKDLAYFGEFGVRGVGYFVRALKEDIKRILGVTRIWKVALVGAGNLGSALLSYKGFLAHGFTIDAVFDKFPDQPHPRKPGIPKVLPMKELRRVVRAKGIKMGIVAVPPEGAQGVVNQLVGAGITGILNFAPIQIQVPRGVKLRNVDLGSELESLAYYLSQDSEE
ncbi:MAG: redox-sensing transcriptional repressor Rex [Nitrospinota bacterium]